MPILTAEEAARLGTLLTKPSLTEPEKDELQVLFDKVEEVVEKF